MREKAKDLVYLDTNRYISIDSIRILYWAIIIIPLIMVVLGFAAINMNGVCWKSLFPLISIATWSMLYWVFVLIIQNKKTKKTFELRFLVNGISGVLLSSLFYLLLASFNIIADDQLFGLEFALWVLFFYLLFSIIYVGVVAFGVHKGIFKKIKEKSQKNKALASSVFFLAILPSAGVMGMYTSKILRVHTSNSVENIIGTLSLVLVIFIPILAHINFVQYYYCKKYKILCDEHGDTTSPNLEIQIKVKQIKVQKETSEKTHKSDNSIPKKKIPLIIKILIGIVSALIIFFIIGFAVFFVKEIIQRIS